MDIKGRLLAGLAAAATLGGCAPKAQEPHVAAASDIAAGRYLVVVGGCNDCHTPGWGATGGKVPEKQWLTGTPVGWQGPWGVTYPQNLRLTVAKMDEDEFVRMLHTRTDRPPMPWMNVARLHGDDARAIYRFIKSLGPAGSPMPAGTPPGAQPTTPFIPIEPPTSPAASTKTGQENRITP